MRTKSLLAVVLVAVATFSLACSKSNDAPVVSAQAGNSSTTAASGSNSGNNGNSSTTAKSGDDNGDKSSSGNTPTGVSCVDAYVAYGTLVAEVTTLQSPTATQEERDKAKKDADAFRDKVPAEIKGDVDTWLKGWNDYINAVASINANGTPSPGDLAKYEEAAKILDDPAFKTAGDNISKYFDTHCKS